MSVIVEQLKKAAGLEKQAYFDYVKSFSSATIASLVKGGVQFEKAASLAQEVCQKDSKVQSLFSNYELMDKVAEYVEVLESKAVEFEKLAGRIEKEEKIEASEPLSKLAQYGFSNEEIEQMSALPDQLLEKVASVNSKPWEMGAGAGIPREKTDPMLEFILT